MGYKGKQVYKPLAVWLALSMTPAAAIAAADVGAQMDQQLQAKQLEANRIQRLGEERVTIPDGRSNKENSQNGGSSGAAITHSETGSSPQFYIRQIDMGAVPKEFAFIKKALVGRENQTYTLASINQLVDALNRDILEAGYVTSRVILPSQNIQAGTLRLLVETGYVGQIGYGPGSAHIPWKNAFPIRKGKLLNIRKLEQGLEQMKRVSSQDVTMELKPGIESHTTDVVLQIKRTDKPIHALISLDNSGLKDTGTLQWNFNVSADQVFRANDTLSFGFNKDGAQEGYEKGTRGHSVSYVIPSGNDTFSFQYYRYTYHQTVPSIPFIFLSSSVTKQERLNWNHVFYRDKQVKRSWNVGVQRRTSHSFINDQEVAVQAMNTTDLLVGFDERRYIKNNTLYTSLSYKRGMGWFGAQEDYAHGNRDIPTTRYHQLLLDVDYVQPRTWGHRPARLLTSFHGQWTLGGDRLYNRDMVSLGNRYTVQGFDGENTLLGESGWYVRQEASSAIPQLHSEVYIQLDMGAVYGPSTDILTGRCIMGAALGLRGQFNSGFFYDAFISAPIYKPDGYKTERLTAGFTAGWRF